MKNFIKFGVYAAVAGMFFSLLSYVTGINRAEWFYYIGFITLLIPIYFISMAIKTKRDQELKGFISYGKAFNEGLLVTLVNGLISTAYSAVYFFLIDPSFIDFQKQKMINQWEEQGMDDAQIEQMLEYSSWSLNPTAYTIISFFVVLFTGVIISLIVAAVMKKPDPEEIS